MIPNEKNRESLCSIATEASKKIELFPEVDEETLRHIRSELSVVSDETHEEIESKTDEFGVAAVGEGDG